ncbi:F-box protein SKIP23-like [Pyrus communis]|uniref:F-box protein SKIP23-like n=1 Tax=Pyrus communis TaxID=23211 RepID=UPI0035C0DD0D
MDSDWKNLPNHLLDLVLEKLASDDFLRFSLVCMSWSSVTKDNPRRPAPMLLVSSGGKQDAWNVYNVEKDKVYDLQLRLPNKRFCGSSKGWLVTVDENFAVTLMNPFARIQGCEENENSIIRLPSLMPPCPTRTMYWARRYDRYVHKATISADPVLNADECIVEVIFGDGYLLASVRPGKDKTWTYREHRTWHFIDDVVHVGDKVYCVDRSDRLNLDGKIIEERIVRKRYLVDLNKKEVLMVKRCFRMERKEGNRRRYPSFVTQKFEIFRWNSEESKWIEMTSLGDVALFVGANDSASVLTSKLPGCQPDCIYFNSDWQYIEWNRQDYGVYNLKTQSISKPYTPHALTLLNMTKQKSIWFLPTLRS